MRPQDLVPSLARLQTPGAREVVGVGRLEGWKKQREEMISRLALTVVALIANYVLTALSGSVLEVMAFS